MHPNIIKRRPGQQPSAFAFDVDENKAYNKTVRYTQGQRIQLVASSNTPFSINLTASGNQFLGVSIVPVAAADITDCQITLSINNNNLLSSVGLSNLNPSFVSNMMFFPLPQQLSGKDTISGGIFKNNAGDVNIIMNVFYVSRLK